MKKFSIIILASLLFSSLANAEVLLIANKNFPEESISLSLVSNIYLGRAFALPSGAKVVPLERPKHFDIKANFHQKLHGKSVNQLNSYWSRLIFTGNNPPPAEVEHDEDVVRLVQQDSRYIGYINSKNLDPAVKVLLKLP